jgi:hypothetical protein
MGKGWEGTEASSGSLGSRQAYHVGICPQEDRGSAASTVGEGEGWEEERGVDRRSLLRRVRSRLSCFDVTLGA